MSDTRHFTTAKIHIYGRQKKIDAAHFPSLSQVCSRQSGCGSILSPTVCSIKQKKEYKQINCLHDFDHYMSRLH